jgi:hypothetical protein
MTISPKNLSTTEETEDTEEKTSLDLCVLRVLRVLRGGELTGKLSTSVA